MDDMTKHSATPAYSPGKQALLDAALRLAADGRTLNSLGLRELAREAGLNPNTFYRHFREMDDLGLTLLRSIVEQVRGPIRVLRHDATARAERQIRQQNPAIDQVQLELRRGRLVCAETVRLFLDYVLANAEVVMVAMREMHGPSELLRREVRNMMRLFADDLAQDIVELKLVSEQVAPMQVRQIAEMVSLNLFFQSLDYIAQPQRRDQLRRLVEEQIMMLFTGAAFLQAVGALCLPEGEV
ncbi:TetR family transcriptional regulator [Halopseudomonas bauzanensis]|uniref:TetR family transcriptional regulator n=1 Tax=Halopseudomonas bauzanensis TaxID=653930 RepID=A0A4U0YHP0_9GAMM|nr:TetR family transcriptional regulator [Halopseudomonas bauzanensis]TKA89546.1 TetR family transcriptional regulator [Halopseudomonas bauzanensis]